MTEAKTPEEYARISEDHARRVIVAYRMKMKYARLCRAEADNDAAMSLQAINDAKRVMFENGWTEDENDT